MTVSSRQLRSLGVAADDVWYPNEEAAVHKLRRPLR